MTLTCCGKKLDDLARNVGGWPEDAVVHTLEVLNGGGGATDPQVLLEGAIPTGEKGGLATFKGTVRDVAFKAVVRLSEYRAAIKRD